MLRHALRWSVALAAVVGFVSVPAGRVRADTAKSIAHYIMGVSYEFQNEADAALSEYQKAIQVDPSSFAAQMRLGIISSQMGHSFLAIKAFTAAIEIEPGDLQARYLLALVYSSVKDFDRAAQQYETILKTFTTIEPQNIEFYIYLGDLYYSQGKMELGIAQFEKVLVLQPKNTEALLQVGAFYLDHQKHSEGIGLLKRCVEADPGHGDCLNALGYAYAEDNIQLDDAKDMIAKALAMEPENAAFLDSLGWVYFKQGKFEDALVLLRKAVAKEEDPAIYDHMGDVYEKLGQSDKALEMWHKALAIDETMTVLKAKIIRVQSVLKKK
jgi:tetratricopeptide (TPR) repeat protein